jgi:hypothetical protein
MQKPDLVFMTKENEETIRQRLAPHVAAELKRLEKEKGQGNVTSITERSAT